MTPILGGSSPEGPLVNQMFGQEGQRVLSLITHIADLSPAEVDKVADAWKQASALDRGRAWARLTCATTERERYRILAAASLARKEALATAHRRGRMDWAFWAAASDAAAAVAAGSRIGRHYEILVAPLAAVMHTLPSHASGKDGHMAGRSEDEPPATAGLSAS